MKITDFKKFIATKPTLELVSYKINDNESPHPYRNVIRGVVTCNSVGFSLVDSNGKESFTNWPKASELTVFYDTKNAMIFYKKFGHIALGYKHIVC